MHPELSGRLCTPQCSFLPLIPCPLSSVLHIWPRRSPLLLLKQTAKLACSPPWSQTAQLAHLPPWSQILISTPFQPSSFAESCCCGMGSTSKQDCARAPFGAYSRVPCSPGVGDEPVLLAVPSNNEAQNRVPPHSELHNDTHLQVACSWHKAGAAGCLAPH